jgi:hypothetical protein
VHLQNISSAFFPSSFTRPPVCDIDDTLPAGEENLDCIASSEKLESDYHLREGEMTIAEELEKEDPVSSN